MDGWEHLGWDEDVQPVGDGDGLVPVSLDLTVVLTTIVHLGEQEEEKEEE